MRRLAVAAAVVALAACTGGSREAVPPSPTDATIEAEPPPSLPPCPPAVDVAPPGPPVEGHDPYVAAGARQSPGPNMTTTTVPVTPVSGVVQVPPLPYDPSSSIESSDTTVPSLRAQQPAPPSDPVGACSSPVGEGDP